MSGAWPPTPWARRRRRRGLPRGTRCGAGSVPASTTVAVLPRASRVETLVQTGVWTETTGKGASRLLLARLRWRRMVRGSFDAALCVSHLRNEHAKSRVQARSIFGTKMADLCVGGERERERERVVGGDANIALFGAIPEMQMRGVELHLCAIHGEFCQQSL